MELSDVGTVAAIALGIGNAAWNWLLHRRQLAAERTADVTAYARFSPDNLNRTFTAYEVVITNHGPAVARLATAEATDARGVNVLGMSEIDLMADLASHETHTVPA